MARAVGHQQVFLAAVERDHGAPGPAPGEHVLDPAVGEDALDEVLAQPGVLKAALLLDRHQRVGGGECGREQAPPAAAGHALFSVDLDPEQAAAGRILLEHEPVQVFGGQFPGAASGVGVHAGGPVFARARGHHPRRLGIAFQTHRLAGDAHAHFHFRADGHQLAPGGQGAGQPAVVLVAAVEPDLLTQQTGADADAERRGGGCFDSAGHGHFPDSRGSKLARWGHS